MTCLSAVLTHRPGAEAREQLDAMRTLAPHARIVACYTGPRADLARFGPEDAVAIKDPSLTAQPRSVQSYHRIFGALHRRWVADDPALTAVYLFEFDHLILSAGFEDALTALAARTNAGFMGKNCGVRSGTNWAHYTRFRHDLRLRSHLRALSVRDDPDRIYGTLGTGMWLSREALASYVAVPEHPPCYGELYVPTVLHHLGHRVVDIDAESDLYRAVRYEPEVGLTEINKLIAAGASFAHPVKDLAVRRKIQAQLAAAS